MKVDYMRIYKWLCSRTPTVARVYLALVFLSRGFFEQDTYSTVQQNGPGRAARVARSNIFLGELEYLAENE